MIPVYEAKIKNGELVRKVRLGVIYMRKQRVSLASLDLTSDCI